MKKNILKKIKKEKGITGIDATIAVVILMIFVPLVAGLFGNIANTSKKIERKVTATNIAIQALESIKKMEYDSIPTGDLTTKEIIWNAGYYTSDNIPQGYSVKINVIKNLENKNIEVTVSYPENSATETLRLQTKIYKN